MTDVAAPHRRLLTGILATAVLALAACSSGGHPSSAGTGGTPSAVGYSQCMRSHGIATFPDPTGNGEIPKETAAQLGVGATQYQAAQTACAHALPGGGGASPSEIAQMMSGMRAFAGCMRSHGVPTWPDPDTDRGGYPVFYLRNTIDQNAPPVAASIHACQPLLPQSGSLSIPGGVAVCPGDPPGPDATSSCGGPHQGSNG